MAIDTTIDPIVFMLLGGLAVMMLVGYWVNRDAKA